MTNTETAVVWVVALLFAALEVYGVWYSITISDSHPHWAWTLGIGCLVCLGMSAVSIAWHLFIWIIRSVGIAWRNE